MIGAGVELTGTSLVAWSIGKAANAVWSKIAGRGPSNALQTALSIALQEFGELRPRVRQIFFNKDSRFWDALQEELILLLQPNTQPDANRLAQRMQPLEAMPIDRLERALEDLFWLIRQECRKQPALIAIEQFRLALNIQEQLDELGFVDKRLTITFGSDSRICLMGRRSLERTNWVERCGVVDHRAATPGGAWPLGTAEPGQPALFRRHVVDGEDGSAMAASSGCVRQVEQRLPALSALGRDGGVRCHAGDPGRTGGSRAKSRHGRQHCHPGASLRSRHKKGSQIAEALGRSRGGFTTKIHARCDAKGRPLGFTLTPGQAHDTQGFLILLRMVGDRIKAMLADKGYDADAIRDALVAEGIEPVIPSKSNRKAPIDYDRELYKQRNLIERMFNKLKNWRRVATRYDKTAESFIGFISIAAVKLWLSFVHEA